MNIRTYIRQRAHLALRATRLANRTAVLDQIEVQAIVQPRRDKRGQEVVRLFHAYIRRDPAEAFRDAIGVRFNREGRRYGLQLYEIW